MRYKIVSWHGEHKTVWYVVDSMAPMEEQPVTMDSSTSKEDMEEVARCLNMAGVVIA